MPILAPNAFSTLAKPLKLLVPIYAPRQPKSHLRQNTSRGAGQVITWKLCHWRNALSASVQLSRMKRLQRVNCVDGLCFLVPLEVTQHHRLGCEIHQQEPVFL